MKRTRLAALLLCVTLPLPAATQDIDVDALIAELNIRESSMPSREMPGWSRPHKITVMHFRDIPDNGLGSGDWYREISDGVEIEIVRVGAEADYSSVADSDVYVGWCISDAIQAGRNLDYIHIFSAGIDGCAAIPGIRSAELIATNSAKAASETIAEHSIAMMLTLTRNLHLYRDLQGKSEWTRNLPDAPATMSVKSKTMLVLGLGGIGTQVASRAHKMGMRVFGTRNSSRTGPEYVERVGMGDEMFELASEADVIVNALPLTDATRKIVGTEFFKHAKKGAYYISVGRGPTTDTAALLKALQNGRLNGAGLDVTDPEPLPEDHELWQMPNVVITPHTAASSELSRRNTSIIGRENLRRYIRGEKLLNMVDLARGY